MTADLTVAEAQKMVPCERCHKPVTPDLHSCPFKADVHDDDAPCCNCCDDCTQECAYDV